MRRFQNQHISVKQIDKVTELVDYINNTRINIMLCNLGECSRGCSMFNLSIFEIKNIDFEDDDFLDKTVYLEMSTKQIINFSNYINNPLIPLEISLELENFQSRKGETFYVNENEYPNGVNAVLVESIKEGDLTIYNIDNKRRNFYINYYAFACEDWNNFKECSKQLENSIRKWYSNYKIKDINLLE